MEFALILPVFVALMGGVFDLSWLAFQRSALAASVALGCRQGAIYDPGIGDAHWSSLVAEVEEGVNAALTATGAPCEPDECVITVSDFGTAPGRSISCTVSRDFSSLTSIALPDMEITATNVVRLEWQR